MISCSLWSRVARTNIMRALERERELKLHRSLSPTSQQGMFKINAVVFIFSVNYLLKCFELSYYMSPRSYTSTHAALGAQILQPSHTGSCKSTNLPGAQS